MKSTKSNLFRCAGAITGTVITGAGIAATTTVGVTGIGDGVTITGITGTGIIATGDGLGGLIAFVASYKKPRRKAGF